MEREARRGRGTCPARAQPGVGALLPPPFCQPSSGRIREPGALPPRPSIPSTWGDQTTQPPRLVDSFNQAKKISGVAFRGRHF